ncbi:glycosyltransferase family 2 protein [Segatella copri]|uniref:glycosyltransferase family 2 protein n=1 Tax=Segatella copri TaxID=165179 RepID=UPI00222EAFCF|nr:glycosyltransferase [Segatella copri]MCW4084242.1 glycosyltransferase [Segatella copri]
MMNESVKVSVIVPIYNVEKYIGKCILSIIEQTYKNIEIILVDDGSLDDSGNIADEYATRDNRIKVIHKANAGVSAARNSGLDAATGDFVCFSDGDDYVMPYYVEHLLKLCLTDNADVAYTVDMYTTFHNEHVANSHVKVITPEDATENILCYKVPIGVYSKLFNREFLVKNNIRFLEDVYIGEGFNFNTACFQRANKVVMSNERIYFYRRDNEASAMTSFKEAKCLMALKAIDIIKDNLVLRTPRVLKAWKFAHWHTHFDMYCWIVNSNAIHINEELYKRCRSVAQKEALIALSVPTKKSERIRGILGLIAPIIVAKLMLWRNKR